MGSSASTIQSSYQNNPELVSKYHNELAQVFASTCQEMSSKQLSQQQQQQQSEEENEMKEDIKNNQSGKWDSRGNSSSTPSYSTKEEIKKKFEEILKENELKMILNIAKSEQLGNISSSNQPITTIIDSTPSSKNTNNRHALNFLVCINGTTASDLGYKSTIRLMNKYDTITLFNVYNPNELERIPLKYHPKHIRDKYQSQLVNTLRSDQYYFYFTENESKDVTAALRDYIQLYHPDIRSTMDYLNEYHLDKIHDPISEQPPPDFVVIGKNRFVFETMESGIIEDPSETAPIHHPESIVRVNSGPINSNSSNEPPGQPSHEAKSDEPMPPITHSHPPFLSQLSRGFSSSMSFRGNDSERKDDKAVGYTLLGSSDISLDSIHLPCIIIKTLVQSTDKHPSTYLLAVNETLRSRRGLDILKKLLNPRDILRMLYVSHRDTSHEVLNEIQSYYNNEIRYYLPPGSTLTIIPMAGRMLPDVILQYANEIQCDYIAVSPRPKCDRKANSMSVTEQILLKSNCNVVICKN